LCIKYNNEIALRVGWKISCWYLVVNVLSVRCSLYVQRRFAVVAMAFER